MKQTSGQFDSFTTNGVLVHLVSDFARLHQAFCENGCAKKWPGEDRHTERCLILCERYGFTPQPNGPQKN